MIGPKQRSEASGRLVVIVEGRGGSMRIRTHSHRDADTYHTSELYNTALINQSNLILTHRWIHHLKSRSKPYLSPCCEMKKLQRFSSVSSNQVTANPGTGGGGEASFTHLEGTAKNLWPWLVTTPWDWRAGNAAMAAGPPVNDLLLSFF